MLLAFHYSASFFSKTIPQLSKQLKFRTITHLATYETKTIENSWYNWGILTFPSFLSFSPTKFKPSYAVPPPPFMIKWPYGPPGKDGQVTRHDWPRIPHSVKNPTLRKIKFIMHSSLYCNDKNIRKNQKEKEMIKFRKHWVLIASLVISLNFCPFAGWTVRFTFYLFTLSNTLSNRLSLFSWSYLNIISSFLL